MHIRFSEVKKKGYTYDASGTDSHPEEYGWAKGTNNDVYYPTICDYEMKNKRLRKEAKQAKEMQPQILREELQNAHTVIGEFLIDSGEPDFDKLAELSNRLFKVLQSTSPIAKTIPIKKPENGYIVCFVQQYDKGGKEHHEDSYEVFIDHSENGNTPEQAARERYGELLQLMQTDDSILYSANLCYIVDSTEASYINVPK